MNRFNSLILAGGKSERLGSPKPFLKFAGDITFLERLVWVYNIFGCNEIILVINSANYEHYEQYFPNSFKKKIKPVINYSPSLGRFFSLKTGAEACMDCEFTFIQNIDNPFTDRELLTLLFNNKKEDAYIYPEYEKKGGHPVLLPKMIMDCIRNESDTGTNFKNFLGRFKCINIESRNKNILANINTAEDYNLYFKHNTY